MIGAFRSVFCYSIIRGSIVSKMTIVCFVDVVNSVRQVYALADCVGQGRT